MSNKKCRRSGENGGNATSATVEVDGGVGVGRLDEMFKVLADRRRRVILVYLQTHDVVTVDDLARHVAASEASSPPDQISAAQCERVALPLLHNHLPQLEDAGFIEYDLPSRTVRSTEHPPLLKTILGLLARVFEEPTE